MYDVDSNPAGQMIRVKLAGFWDMPLMSAYSKEIIRHAKLLEAHGGCKRVLVDMSDYPIQSREVAQAHIDALTYTKTKMGARVALVTTSSLSRLQTARMAKTTGHVFFDDEASAMKWLHAAA